MTREKCINLIGEVYQEFLRPRSSTVPVSSETRLFGRGSPLDSTALVSLLIEVEQQVNEACNTEIVIADDRAVSQEHSPFRTIGSLADYIQVLLSEQRQN